MKRRRQDSSDPAARWAQARAARGDAEGIRVLRSFLGDSSHDPAYEPRLGPAFDPWIGPEPTDFGPTLGEFAARRLEELGAAKQERPRSKGRKRSGR